MLFNSFHFAIFLPIVFIIYWCVRKKRQYQNIFLLICSYYFYACWDWRFLFLLVFSTFLDYFSGLKISNSQNKKTRRFWFWTSIIINISFLLFFKYYNFFIESFTDSMKLFGIQFSPWMMNILLPVGISFYTFHGVSYVIDIYNDRIKAEKNFIDYSLFVSFFPLLVAGPIERATHLLPQIKAKRTFNYHQAADGLKQILWGLFKKMVIADGCAHYANIIFNNYENYYGTTLLFGAFLFTIQIYGDFSGYSDIALGTARLFGIELIKNFNYPYFSKNIAEFWRRWHISLSSWFKDYLYIPLGGGKCNYLTKIRNIFIIFLVSGFWHGANWTFIFWGGLNALFILPSMLKTNKNKIDKNEINAKVLPSIKDLFKIFITFIATIFCWIFFRSSSIHDSFNFLKLIIARLGKNIGYPIKLMEGDLTILVLIFIMFIFEWIKQKEDFPLRFHKTSIWVRWCIYLFIAIIIFLFHGEKEEFIYFQF